MMMIKTPAFKSLKLITIFTLFSVLLFSCNKKEKQAQEFSQTNKTSSEPEVNKAAEGLSQKIDLDLTKMSATMIYSTVFDMLIASEDYEGKNIKISGLFKVFENEEKGKRYFAVLVPDATACCQQGLEFVWLGNHSYPSDYPPEDSEITITGRYRTEEEDGLSYSYLQVTEFDW